MSVRGDELTPSFCACTIRRRWPPEPDGRGRVQNLDNCIGKTSNSVPKGSRLCRAAPKAGSQATKGARWMPWRQGPRKDAVGGDRTGEEPKLAVRDSPQALYRGGCGASLGRTAVRPGSHQSLL